MGNGMFECFVSLQQNEDKIMDILEKIDRTINESTFPDKQWTSVKNNIDDQVRRTLEATEKIIMSLGLLGYEIVSIDANTVNRITFEVKKIGGKKAEVGQMLYRYGDHTNVSVHEMDRDTFMCFITIL